MEHESESVVCGGGDSFGGHPRVFLDISKKGEATCPYCGRVFKQNKGKAA